MEGHVFLQRPAFHLSILHRRKHMFLPKFPRMEHECKVPLRISITITRHLKPLWAIYIFFLHDPSEFFRKQYSSIQFFPTMNALKPYIWKIMDYRLIMQTLWNSVRHIDWIHRETLDLAYVFLSSRAYVWNMRLQIHDA